MENFKKGQRLLVTILETSMPGVQVGKRKPFQCVQGDKFGFLISNSTQKRLIHLYKWMVSDFIFDLDRMIVKIEPDNRNFIQRLFNYGK